MIGPICFSVIVIALLTFVIIGHYNEREIVKKNKIRMKLAEKEAQRIMEEAQQLEKERAQYEEYLKCAQKGSGRPIYSSFEMWRFSNKE